VKRRAGQALRVRLRRTDFRARVGSRRLSATVAVGAVGAFLILPSAAPAAAPASNSAFPAAGRLVQPTAALLVAPRTGARRLTLVRQFRADYRPQIVLVTAARSDRAGRLWYRVEVASPTNRLSGWVAGRALSVTSVPERIVIRRGARLLELFRGRRLLVRTRIAVGKPGAETPLGRFYVTAKFRPTLPVLGEYALETSAHSRLSDWPGGGIVGIHGTPSPWLLGQAVSHGCIRVQNGAILRLKRLVPLGTSITVVR
jgi:lipoprotein-anchoring transpeptidase ErfK/SrfK